jgi:hypothetical protein
MSHFGTNSNGIKKTPTEWLPVGKQIGELSNLWSGRSDLIAYAGTELASPAPALYNPASYEIEVNTEVAFGKTKPGMIADLTIRDNQYDYPKAVGAIFHEACHARFSRWSMENAFAELTENQYQALILLEESRIEAWGVRTIPSNRYFLSACALEIVLGDAKESLIALSNTRASAHLAGLVLARIDAGVLERSDVDKIASIVEEKLGEELLGQLQVLWRQAQAHDNHTDASAMYPLAIEWDRLVSEKAKENGEEGEDGEPTDEGDPGEGEGEGKGKGGRPGEGTGKGEGGSGRSKSIEEMLEEIKNAQENAEIKANDKLTDQQVREEWAETAKSKATDAKEKTEHLKASQRVFGEQETDKSNGSSSTLQETRKPNSAERASAVKIARLLEKAKYRNRTEKQVTAIIPPGKLRTRAVIQQQALKAKGSIQQVETWRKTIRKHTENPNLTIGVMVDISGSMGMAMNPMASTAWIMSEAGRRVQAKTAMVYFGSGVFSTLRKGQHLDEVKVYNAPDGTEKFDEAFQALDGELDLLHSTNARLLVVVSDACFTGDQIVKTKKWLDRCKSAGVGVLWITYEAGLYAKEVTKNSDAIVVAVKGDITAVAEIIGKAGADALTKAGTRLGR